jgi:5-methylcytosine-specific restriction endonuclease McrA
MTTRKPISACVRRELLTRNQCANSPTNPAPGCRGYSCPMWNFRNGLFDESGFEIDHIIEVTHGGTNELNNLQVLCHSCHAVKTKRCAKQKWDFNSNEIDSGRSYMDVCKKRKRSNST